MPLVSEPRIAVTSFRLVTDAPPAAVSRLLGEVWQSAFLRSRLGRIEELEADPATYRLMHLGNEVDVVIRLYGGHTVLTTAVRRAHDLRASAPVLGRLLDVNRLTRRVVGEGLRLRLRAGGYRVGVRTSTGDLVEGIAEDS